MLTVDEAAQLLRLSPYRVREKARTGSLPAVKVGRAWLFRPEDLEAITAGTAAPADREPADREHALREALSDIVLAYDDAEDNDAAALDELRRAIEEARRLL